MSNRFRSSKKDLVLCYLEHGLLIQNAIRSSIVVISTGTPSGVGMARKPPLWLKPGDRIEIEIEGIGTLENGVVDEQRPR